jgi:hypothetical protein
MPVQLLCILSSQTSSAGGGAGVGEGEGVGVGVGAGVGAGDGAGAAQAAKISEITNTEAIKTVKILVFNISLLYSILVFWWQKHLIFLVHLLLVHWIQLTRSLDLSNVYHYKGNGLFVKTHSRFPSSQTISRLINVCQAFNISNFSSYLLCLSHVSSEDEL